MLFYSISWNVINTQSNEGKWRSLNKGKRGVFIYYQGACDSVYDEKPCDI